MYFIYYCCTVVALMGRTEDSFVGMLGVSPILAWEWQCGCDRSFGPRICGDAWRSKASKPRRLTNLWVSSFVTPGWYIAGLPGPDTKHVVRREHRALRAGHLMRVCYITTAAIPPLLVAAFLLVLGNPPQTLNPRPAAARMKIEP
jgi:hypothetical protein